MLDDIEKVKKFYEKVRSLRIIGLNERQMARQLGLTNNRSEPSITKLREYYSIASKRLKQLNSFVARGETADVDYEFIDILNMAGYINSIGESDENAVMSDLRKTGRSTSSITRAMKICDFDKYLERNEDVYTSYVLI